MSVWKTYYHLVWATYQRRPIITETSEPKLYDYITLKCEELHCPLYAIGGMSDHLHIVVSIPPNLSIAEFAKRIKGSSSRFMNQCRLGYQFTWQREYGVFSLGSKQLDRAIDYVQNQKAHHHSGQIHRSIEPEILDSKTQPNED